MFVQPFLLAFRAGRIVMPYEQYGGCRFCCKKINYSYERIQATREKTDRLKRLRLVGRRRLLAAQLRGHKQIAGRLFKRGSPDVAGKKGKRRIQTTGNLFPALGVRHNKGDVQVSSP